MVERICTHSESVQPPRVPCGYEPHPLLWTGLLVRVLTCHGHATSIPRAWHTGRSTTSTCYPGHSAMKFRHIMYPSNNLVTSAGPCPRRESPVRQVILGGGVWLGQCERRATTLPALFEPAPLVSSSYSTITTTTGTPLRVHFPCTLPAPIHSVPCHAQSRCLQDRNWPLTCP